MGPYPPEEERTIFRAYASPIFRMSCLPDPTTEQEEAAQDAEYERASADVAAFGRAVTSHRRLADWPPDARGILKRALDAVEAEERKHGPPALPPCRVPCRVPPSS